MTETVTIPVDKPLCRIFEEFKFCCGDFNEYVKFIWMPPVNRNKEGFLPALEVKIYAETMGTEIRLYEFESSRLNLIHPKILVNKDGNLPLLTALGAALDNIEDLKKSDVDYDFGKFVSRPTKIIKDLKARLEKEYIK